MRGPNRPTLPKICHTYPTMMKLGTIIPYLKRIREIYGSRETCLEFCWHQQFFNGNQQILLYQEIMYRLHFETKLLILLTFLESMKIILIKKVAILVMSAKMATPGLLKIKIFWKSYDVIINVYDVTNKILSSDSNYIVDAVMWPKFGNQSISMREVIIISILWRFDQKNRFFEGWSWFKFNN